MPRTADHKRTSFSALEVLGDAEGFPFAVTFLIQGSMTVADDKILYSTPFANMQLRRVHVHEVTPPTTSEDTIVVEDQDAAADIAEVDVAATEYTGVDESPTGGTLPKGTNLAINVDAVGSGSAGADASVTLEFSVHGTDVS